MIDQRRDRVRVAQEPFHFHSPASLSPWMEIICSSHFFLRMPARLKIQTLLFGEVQFNL